MDAGPQTQYNISRYSLAKESLISLTSMITEKRRSFAVYLMKQEFIFHITVAVAYLEVVAVWILMHRIQFVQLA